MTGREDTITAIATPAGRGGIGIVRISGSKSFDVAYSITGIRPEPRRACYSAFRDSEGRIIDKGVLICFKGPNSFTGEDVAELQGHGGQVVMRMLLDETVRQGARLARPGEFTERAFLNNKIDLVQAEAVADLIDSSSAQAARSAIRSLEGEFSVKIHLLLNRLVELRVYIEGALDFPEEEIDFLRRPEVKNKIDQLVSDLGSILSNARSGRVLREGIRIAIIGRPNTGKSSLLNRLSGSDRAIVTDVAGTTRDVIEDTVLVDGIAVNLVDTAGIQNSNDIIEQEGIRRSLRELDRADVILLVEEYDPAGPVNDQDLLPKGMTLNPEKTIFIHNKIDLHNKQAAQTLMNGGPHVYLSAKTGEGVDILKEALKQTSGINNLGEDIVLARGRHIMALEKVKQHIQQGLSAYQSAGSSEFLAEELSAAQQQLGSITGDFNVDDLLEEIFSRFCIGK